MRRRWEFPRCGSRRSKADDWTNEEIMPQRNVECKLVLQPSAMNTNRETKENGQTQRVSGDGVMNKPDTEPSPSLRSTTTNVGEIIVDSREDTRTPIRQKASLKDPHVDDHEGPYREQIIDRDFRRHSQGSQGNDSYQHPSMPRAESPESYVYPPHPTYSYPQIHGKDGSLPSQHSSHYEATGMAVLPQPGIISRIPYPYHPPPPYPGYAQYHWAPIAPIEYISEIQPSDVLSGRGGATNSHSGNRAFRSLVKQFQDKYLRAKKRDKPAVASIIVQKIRDKGGRFLKRVDTAPDGQVLWIDIGDERAKEKACQALREGAPEIRRKSKTASTDEDDDKKSRDDSGTLSADSRLHQSSGNHEGSVFATNHPSVMCNHASRSYPWHHSVQPHAAAPIMIRPSATLIKRPIPEAISVDELDPHDREIYLRDFLPPDPRIRKVVGGSYIMQPSNSLSEVTTSTRRGKINPWSVVKV